MNNSAIINRGAHTRRIVSIALACGIFSLAGRLHAQTISSPVGGDLIKKGSGKVHVNWQGATVNQQFLVAASYDGGATFPDQNSVLAATTTSGYWPWTPTQTSTQAVVALLDATTHSAFFQSGPFTVYSNDSVSFTVTSPAASTAWKQDSVVTIRWTTANPAVNSPEAPDTVAVQVTVGSQQILVATNLPHDATSATWHVARKPSANVSVDIGTIDNNSFRSHATLAGLTITGAQAAFTYPVQGSIVPLGQADTIKWTFSLPVDGPIKLLFNRNNGNGAWDTLSKTLTASTRQYIWSPTSATDLAIFRVIADSGYLVLNSAVVSIAVPGGVAEGVAPGRFDLGQNFPNPFSMSRNNGATSVPFSLAAGTTTGLRVFDVLGRTIAQTPLQFYDAGQHAIRFDGSWLAPGVYGYQLIGGATRRIMSVVR